MTLDERIQEAVTREGVSVIYQEKLYFLLQDYQAFENEPVGTGKMFKEIILNPLTQKLADGTIKTSDWLENVCDDVSIRGFDKDQARGLALRLLKSSGMLPEEPKPKLPTPKTLCEAVQEIVIREGTSVIGQSRFVDYLQDSSAFENEPVGTGKMFKEIILNPLTQKLADGTIKTSDWLENVCDDVSIRGFDKDQARGLALRLLKSSGMLPEEPKPKLPTPKTLCEAVQEIVIREGTSVIGQSRFVDYLQDSSAFENEPRWVEVIFRRICCYPLTQNLANGSIRVSDWFERVCDGLNNWGYDMNQVHYVASMLLESSGLQLEEPRPKLPTPKTPGEAVQKKVIHEGTSVIGQSRVVDYLQEPSTMMNWKRIRQVLFKVFKYILIAVAAFFVLWAIIKVLAFLLKWAIVLLVIVFLVKILLEKFFSD